MKLLALKKQDDIKATALRKASREVWVDLMLQRPMEGSSASLNHELSALCTNLPVTAISASMARFEDQLALNVCSCLPPGVTFLH